MRLFDSRLMQLLTFLSRRQAWLAPHEIARDFRLDGRKITPRTVHRWFRFLRAEGGFVYYPYPRANALGLQDVLVWIRGLRNPEVLGVLPFSASFSVDVGLAESEPFVSQTYWVPGTAVEAFRDCWRAARDVGLIAEFEVFQARNTHFFFSPFHKMVREDGTAEFRDPVDNSYFENLVKRNLRRKFEVRVGEMIAKSPLIVPVVVEHIWSHHSSRQVWQEIRSKGEARILEYGKGIFSRALQRPGVALRILQEQWSAILENFEEVFLQPRVLFHWPSLRNAMFANFVLKPGPLEKMVEAAERVSRRSIFTSLKPGVEFEERCHISCFLPNDQFIPVLKIVREYHHGREPPAVAIQDKQATTELFQPSFCKLDWRLFDPSTLSWRFNAEAYVEQMKRIAA